MPFSPLTRDGSIYGPFHDPNRANECSVLTHWQLGLGLIWPGMVISLMVPSMNQTDLVSVDSLLSCNMPCSTLSRHGSISYGPFDESNRLGECGLATLWQYSLVYSDPGWKYIIVPSMIQTDLVSVAYQLSGNMRWCTLTRNGSICYGHFDESNWSGECGLSPLWQYALFYADPGW